MRSFDRCVARPILAGIKRVACLTLLVGVSFGVMAQVPVVPSIDAGAIQRRSMELEKLMQENTKEPPAVLKPLEQTPPGDASRVQANGGSFLLKQVRFTPSEILTPEELAAMAGEYEGREVSMADLQRLLDSINRRYRELGAMNAQASLPPQEVVDGVVQIRLIERRDGKHSGANRGVVLAVAWNSPGAAQ